MVRSAGRYIAVLAILTLLLVTTYYTIPQQQNSRARIRVAATTSLYSTGLLDYIAHTFSIENDVVIDFIVVGTGASLRLAELGDVCVVFVHSPPMERVYKDRGVIERGRIFAYNYFVLVGPASDPANVSGAASIVEAFKRIFESGEGGRAFFVSRGDGSGTHSRELIVWSRAGLDSSGKKWYKECGCGMTDALIIAEETGSYTLSDVGTYLVLKRATRLRTLEVLYVDEFDPLLINIYSVYVASKCFGVERKHAEHLIDFVYLNQERLLLEFNKKYGVNIFLPAKTKEDVLMELWTTLSFIG